jgi:hypothetical protein
MKKFNTRDSGDPNPKTKIRPVIAPRSHDLERWRTSDAISHSRTNSATMNPTFDSDPNQVLGNRLINSSKYHPDSVSVRKDNGDLVEEYIPISLAELNNFSHPSGVMFANPHGHHPDGIHPKNLFQGVNWPSFSRNSHDFGFYDFDTLHGHNAGHHHHDDDKIKNELRINANPNTVRKIYNDTIEHMDVDLSNLGGYDLLDRTTFLPENRFYNNLALHKSKNFRDYTRQLHRSNIEPKGFADYQVIEPISSNNGITFNPDYKFVIGSKVNVSDTNGQIGNSGYYASVRVDPQLIRDNENSKRLMENPDRNHWTQKYSKFEAQPGTISPDKVYDPRTYGNGDSSRSFYDPNLGQIKYYYGDVSATRGSSGNFIIRSRVDHMDFQDPMSRMIPEFVRTPLDVNSRELVHNKWMADTTAHRESIMESIMQKKTRESWQQRYAPIDRSQTGRRGV